MDAFIRPGHASGGRAVKRIIYQRGRSSICPLFFCGDHILRIAAVAGLTCALVADVPAQNAAQKKPQTSSGRTAPKSASKSSSAHKAPAKSGSKAATAHSKPPAGPHAKAPGKSGKTTARRGKKGSSKAAWRSRQLAPTPDRYKDIQ